MEKGFASFNTYIIYPEQILKRISRTAWLPTFLLNVDSMAVREIPACVMPHTDFIINALISDKKIILHSLSARPVPLYALLPAP